MSTDDSFLTVSNIRNLMQIFDRFLRDRYSLAYDPSTLNIKELIYETMIKVKSQNKGTPASLVQLNKLTLATVKTITKKKLHLDNRFNGTLTRDRDIMHPHTTANNVFSRPIQGISEQSKQSMMYDFDSLVKGREVEQVPPSMPKSMDGSSVNSISQNDFSRKLETLMNNRETVSTSEQPSSREAIVADIYKDTYAEDPKEFFASAYGSTNATLGKDTSYAPSAYDTIEKSQTDNIGIVGKPAKQQYTEMRTAYIVIDSRNRPNANTTTPCEYVIEFDSPIKNIASIELTYALYDAVTE